MRLFTVLFALVLITAHNGITAQNNLIERADQYFQDFDFTRAIESYEKAIKKDSANAYAMHQIGQAYRLIGENQKANPWYELALKVNPTSKKDLYYYARTLLSVGKYDKALEYYQKYDQLYPGDPRAIEYVQNPDFYQKLTGQAEFIQVNPLPINSPNSDYGPARLYNKIIFTSSRDREIAIKHKSTWKNEPFLDLYTIEKNQNGLYSEPKLLGQPITTKWHEGSASFDRQTDRLYFTRTSLSENQLETDQQGVVNIEIYSAYLTPDNTWDQVVPFEFNNKEYSIAQPAISADGTQLYFVSDMPGGLGGADLYLSTLVDGKWSEPVNLGPPVNTQSHEKNPYVDPNGNLYFASTGHLGLGGMDIYRAKPNPKGFEQPENLGFPINTRFDDFCFTFEDDSLQTFLFASNREGGKGEDDIYQGAPKIIPISIAAYVTTKESLKDMPVTLIVTDAKGRVIASDTLVNSKAINLKAHSFDQPYAIAFYPLFDNEKLGGFENIDPKTAKNNTLDLGEITLGEDLAVAAVDPGQVTDPNDYTITKGTNNEGIIILKNTQGKPIEKSAGPAYFGFDRYDLDQKAIQELQDVIDILNTLPEIKVTISGHADARGPKSYNLVLSQKRATAAMNYLLDHGVDLSRINVIGYGESKPVNGCIDGVNCPESQHAKNRRTEFEFGEE